MKKLYFAIFALVSGHTFGQTMVNFEDFILGSSETYFDGSDFSGTSNGNGQLETIYTQGSLTFNSIYDTTWGANSGYWSTGWAFSNVTTDTLQGFAGLFSSYAGGGDNSANYVIGQNGSIISSDFDQVYFGSLRLTNNNYAASSMLNGDQFAKKFGGATGDDPDWFLLTIVGYNMGGAAFDSVEVYLADYRFSDNSMDYIVKDWLDVDLTPLGGANSIKFKLSSSDNSGGFMNTPSFFAVDNVEELAVVGIHEKSEISINVYPNPVKDFLNVSSEGDIQEVIITNLQGQVVYRETGIVPITSINVGILNSGFYQISVSTKYGTITKKFQKF